MAKQEGPGYYRGVGAGEAWASHQLLLLELFQGAQEKAATAGQSQLGAGWALLQGSSLAERTGR